MTIKEIEALTGLPRANVRYYEAEGLIHPERKENGYRIYSEEDAAALQKIRLLYWVFDVTIPAGETVEVEANYHQEASTDFGGGKKRREGYDMATRLGSELNFTALSASVTNPEFIEILRQNFGFNLKKNITRVELSLEKERYFLEIGVKED